MVAITVILAAVIGTFVLDLGQSAGNSAPQASMSVTLDEPNEKVTIEHNGGDSLSADQTRVIIEANASASSTYDSSTAETTLTVGNSVTFSTDQPNVEGAWSAAGFSQTGTFHYASGQTLEITVIDLDSQRQIFQTTVTA
jgi:FlaG/FlaF family flagellin (archaellin)